MSRSLNSSGQLGSRAFNITGLEEALTTSEIVSQIDSFGSFLAFYLEKGAEAQQYHADWANAVAVNASTYGEVHRFALTTGDSDIVIPDVGSEVCITMLPGVDMSLDFDNSGDIDRGEFSQLYTTNRGRFPLETNEGWLSGELTGPEHQRGVVHMHRNLGGSLDDVQLRFVRTDGEVMDLSATVPAHAIVYAELTPNGTNLHIQKPYQKPELLDYNAGFRIEMEAGTLVIQADIVMMHVLSSIKFVDGGNWYYYMGRALPYAQIDAHEFILQTAKEMINDYVTSEALSYFPPQFFELYSPLTAVSQLTSSLFSRALLATTSAPEISVKVTTEPAALGIGVIGTTLWDGDTLFNCVETHYKEAEPTPILDHGVTYNAWISFNENPIAINYAVPNEHEFTQGGHEALQYNGWQFTNSYENITAYLNFEAELTTIPNFGVNRKVRVDSDGMFGTSDFSYHGEVDPQVTDNNGKVRIHFRISLAHTQITQLPTMPFIDCSSHPEHITWDYEHGILDLPESRYKLEGKEYRFTAVGFRSQTNLIGPGFEHTTTIKPSITYFKSEFEPPLEMNLTEQELFNAVMANTVDIVQIKIQLQDIEERLSRVEQLTSPNTFNIVGGAFMTAANFIPAGKALTATLAIGTVIDTIGQIKQGRYDEAVANTLACMLSIITHRRSTGGRVRTSDDIIGEAQLLVVPNKDDPVIKRGHDFNEKRSQSKLKIPDSLKRGAEPLGKYSMSEPFAAIRSSRIGVIPTPNREKLPTILRNAADRLARKNLYPEHHQVQMNSLWTTADGQVIPVYTAMGVSDGPQRFLGRFPNASGVKYAPSEPGMIFAPHSGSASMPPRRISEFTTNSDQITRDLQVKCLMQGHAWSSLDGQKADALNYLYDEKPMSHYFTNRTGTIEEKPINLGPDIIRSLARSQANWNSFASPRAYNLLTGNCKHYSQAIYNAVVNGKNDPSMREFLTELNRGGTGREKFDLLDFVSVWDDVNKSIIESVKPGGVVKHGSNLYCEAYKILTYQEGL